MPVYPLPSSPLFEKVDREIHPDCEMHGFALRRHDAESAYNYYFYATHHLIEGLLGAFAGLGIDRDRSLLDFACGYGRTTRFLVHLFPEVVVADVEPEMIAFARERFGVEGFVSSPDAEELRSRCDRSFGAVFCFSLFSHLREDAWRAWLRALFGRVEEGGWLIFSTRSTELAQRMAGGPKEVSLVGEPRLQLADRSGGAVLSGLSVETGRAFSGTLHATLEATGATPPTVGAPRVRGHAAVPLEVGEPLVDPCPGRERHAIRLRVPVRVPRALPSTPMPPVEIPLALPAGGCLRLADDPLGPVLCEEPEREFDFTPSNETGTRLDHRVYGGATVTDRFVRRAIARELPGGRLAGWLPMGLGDLFQDLWFVRRER